MIRPVLRKWFWNTYDHLGACVVLNMLWFILSIPWIIVGYFLAILLTRWLGPVGLITALAGAVASIWLSPASLEMLSAAAAWADYRNPAAGELWTHFKRRLGLGLWTSALALVVSSILGVNGAFYLRLPGGFRWVGIFLAGIMLWAQIGFLAFVFHTGLVLADGSATSLRDAMRRALVLLARFPVQTVVLASVAVIVATLFVVTQFAIPFAAMAIPATLAATGERELRKKLNPQTPAESEADRLEEVRTLRDLIKPWEMRR